MILVNIMLPEQYKQFREKFPQIMKLYDELGNAVHEHGPLDEKTRRLVKLAYAIALGSEGGTHAQVRKALDAGCTEDEIFHVLLLALQTMGFAKTVAAFTWINDVLKES